MKLIASILAFLTLCSCGGRSEVRGMVSEILTDTIPVRTLPDTITVAVVGDIMMGTDYPSVALPPENGKHLFDDCKDVLRNADVAAGNLEGILGTCSKCRKDVSRPLSFAFRMPPALGPNLVDAGFDFMNLANNHINDFFKEGIDETCANLDDLGIAYAGLERSPYAIRELNGIRFGFCSFGHESYELCNYDYERIGSILAALRDSCDIVLVGFHGGAEGESVQHLPDKEEYFCGENRGHLRKFTHFCIDNGADVVFGSGPHVTRAVELYKGHFIAYSLGNFCAPYGLGSSGVKGYAPVVEIKISPEGTYLDGTIHSLVQIRGVGPRKDKSGAPAKKIMELTRADIAPENIPDIKLN